MAKILDTLTGQVSVVPDDVAEPQVKKSPRYQDVTSGRAEVVEQSGRRGTVPLADLQKAAASGMTFLPGGAVEEERLQETYGNQYLRGNAEALARGLTVGISDEVLTQSGAVTPEALRERQERVPGTTVAELTGAIAPALIPGVGEVTVSGNVARLGAAAGKVASTAAGKALVTGAVEGGLFGLGGLLTEHSMGKVDLSAEKAVAALGTGALFGAATGYGLEKGSELFQHLAGGRLRKAVKYQPGEVPGEGRVVRPNARTMEEEASELGVDVVDLADARANELNKARGLDVEVSAQSTRVDSGTTQGADAEGAAGKIPGTSGTGAKPPPPEPTEFVSPVGDARKLKEVIQQGAEKNPGMFRRLFEAFDLSFPDADGFILRGLDAKKAQVKKLRNSGLLRDAPAELRADPRFKGVAGDERWVNGVKNGEDAAELIGLKVKEGGEKYAKALQELDAARLPEEGVDGFELARRIQRNVLEPLKDGPAAAEPVAQQVDAEIQKLLSKSDEQGHVSLDAAERIKRQFDEYAQFNKSTPPAERSKAMAYRDMREQVKKAVEEHADAISNRVGGDAAVRFREAKRSLHKMKSLEEIAKDRLEDAKGANRVFSLTDNLGGFIAGAMGGGLTPVGIATGLGAALLNKWGRENLPWVLAKALTKYDGSGAARLATRGLRELVEKADDEYRATARRPLLPGGPEPRALAAGAAEGGPLRLPSGLPPELPGGGGALSLPPPSALARRAGTTLAEASQETAERLTPRLSTGEKLLGGGAGPVHPGGLGVAAPASPPLPDVGHAFGMWADTLRRAAVLGDRELWLTHVLLSKDPQYRSTLQEMGGTDFSPEGDRRAQRRGTAFEALGNLNRKFDGRVDRALTGFLKGGPWARPAPALERVHLEKAQSLLRLSTSPEALTSAISAELGSLPEHAPATSESMGAVLSRAVAFLAGKAPREPEQPMGEVRAMRRPFRPPSTEVARFARYLAAVEDPGGVLEGMAGGAVTREAVEAMEQVYPALWGELRGKLVERLATAGTALDYRQRLALAQVLGPQAVQVAASPQALKVLQGTFEGAQEGQGGGRSQRPPADGRVGKRIQVEQSPGDRAASR